MDWQQRVQRLERENRWFKVAFILLLAFSAGIPIIGAAGGKADNRREWKDENGKVRMSLLTSDRITRLDICDQGGRATPSSTLTCI
jgi:hypothetical protein